MTGVREGERQAEIVEEMREGACAAMSFRVYRNRHLDKENAPCRTKQQSETRKERTTPSESNSTMSAPLVCRVIHVMTPLPPTPRHRRPGPKSPSAQGGRSPTRSAPVVRPAFSRARPPPQWQHRVGLRQQQASACDNSCSCRATAAAAPSSLEGLAPPLRDHRPHGMLTAAAGRGSRAPSAGGVRARRPTSTGRQAEHGRTALRPPARTPVRSTSPRDWSVRDGGRPDERRQASTAAEVVTPPSFPPPAASPPQTAVATQLPRGRAAATKGGATDRGRHRCCCDGHRRRVPPLPRTIAAAHRRQPSRLAAIRRAGGRSVCAEKEGRTNNVHGMPQTAWTAGQRCSQS